MERLQKFGVGFGVLLLCISLSIAGDSDPKIHNRQMDIKFSVLQSAGRECLEYSDLPKTDWDEYAFCDAATTPESIFINTYAYIDVDIPIDRGVFRPDGFEVFRSTDGKKFKRIKVVNQEIWQLGYTDKTVQGHQIYYYKVRAFRKIRDKKYYGAFSSVMRYAAVNSTASYSVKVLTEEGDGLSSLTVCLTSDEGNEDFIFNFLDGDFYNESDIIDVKLEQYSYDGKSWSVPKAGALVLKAGQRMYLRFVGYDYERYSYKVVGGRPIKKFSYKRGERAEIGDIYGHYNHLSYILSIDLNELEASARVDGEAYH